MNINLKQALGGSVVVLAVLMISSANLQDLFGPGVAKKIVSGAAILNGICGGWLTILTSQTNVVYDASQTKGVEVQVTAKASPTIAAMAVDPANSSIAPAHGQENAVADKAKEA